MGYEAPWFYCRVCGLWWDSGHNLRELIGMPPVSETPWRGTVPDAGRSAAWRMYCPECDTAILVEPPGGLSILFRIQWADLA
jgi:hypothetical protein